LLDGVAMFSMWGAREPGKSANSTPNVQTSDGTCMCQFAWNIAAGETF
jgi:hypothetical protein